MAVTVSKSTVVENIYKNFYDLINAISGFSGICYPEFHENHDFDDKADYPVVIIGSPEVSWESFTFGKNVLSGTIEIDIYTTTAPLTDQYTSDISNQIDSSKHTLADQGLKMVELESTSKNVVTRGNINIHMKTLIFKFMFYFDKTTSGY
uniref:Tail protein n=1 Tax=viral metagenome TaxID=1070528 RepID=A0A6M3K1W6_9ZZZZ